MYTFDVPQLVGTYPGSGGTIAFNLGVSFSDIDAVSLRLSGTHQVGSYSDLNFPGTFPYPAEVVGFFHEQTWPNIAGFDTILPASSGPFDTTFAFRSFDSRQPIPDLSPLLDGLAAFDFGAGGPALIATTYVTADPRVTVATATLIVDGQSAISLPLPGDFDASGVVDEGDLTLWLTKFGATDDLRADGNGNGIVDAADYTVWRDHMHSSGASGSGAGAAPEPATVFLLVAVAPLMLNRSLRRRLLTSAA